MTVRNNPRANYWNVESGYRPNVNQSMVYPCRVFGSGANNAFGIMASSILDDSLEQCNFLAHGFHVWLHPPNELPQLSTDYTFVSIKQSARISIRPKITATSNGLRQYAPHVRGCYFQSERRLRFFRSYNQANCELECLTNHTRNECGCVPYWMLSKPFNKEFYFQFIFFFCAKV